MSESLQLHLRGKSSTTLVLINILHVGDIIVTWLKTRNKEIEKSEHILNNVLGDIYNVSLSILRITKYIIYVF